METKAFWNRMFTVGAAVVLLAIAVFAGVSSLSGASASREELDLIFRLDSSNDERELMSAAVDPDEDIRAAAVRRLGVVGSRSSGALTLVNAHVFNDPSRDVRDAAMFAYFNIRYREERAGGIAAGEDFLINEALGDTGSMKDIRTNQVVIWAMGALSDMGSSRAASSIEEMLAPDKSLPEVVREEAAGALKKIEFINPGKVPAAEVVVSDELIDRALNEPDYRIHDWGVRAAAEKEAKDRKVLSSNVAPSAGAYEFSSTPVAAQAAANTVATESGTQSSAATDNNTLSQSETNTTTETTTETQTETTTETQTQTTTETQTGTQTETTTDTGTATETHTETSTETMTETTTETQTQTTTETHTETQTETATQTQTETATETQTGTQTETTTDTGTTTGTQTETATDTNNSTDTDTSNGTDTDTNTLTTSETATVTETDTNTLTTSETSTETETQTETATETMTETATETQTETQTGTQTETTTETETATVTETATETNTATETATVTETDTVTVTETDTETVTETDTETHTVTVTDTATETDTETYTETDTGTQTETSTETATDTETWSNTGTDSQTNSTTDSGTETGTETSIGVDVYVVQSDKDSFIEPSLATNYPELLFATIIAVKTDADGNKTLYDGSEGEVVVRMVPGFIIGEAKAEQLDLDLSNIESVFFNADGEPDPSNFTLFKAMNFTDIGLLEGALGTLGGGEPAGANTLDIVIGERGYEVAYISALTSVSTDRAIPTSYVQGPGSVHIDHIYSSGSYSLQIDQASFKRNNYPACESDTKLRPGNFVVKGSRFTDPANNQYENIVRIKKAESSGAITLQPDGQLDWMQVAATQVYNDRIIFDAVWQIDVAAIPGEYGHAWYHTVTLHPYIYEARHNLPAAEGYGFFDVEIRTGTIRHEGLHSYHMTKYGPLTQPVLLDNDGDQQFIMEPAELNREHPLFHYSWDHKKRGKVNYSSDAQVIDAFLSPLPNEWGDQYINKDKVARIAVRLNPKLGSNAAIVFSREQISDWLGGEPIIATMTGYPSLFDDLVTNYRSTLRSIPEQPDDQFRVIATRVRAYSKSLSSLYNTSSPNINVLVDVITSIRFSSQVVQAPTGDYSTKKYKFSMAGVDPLEAGIAPYVKDIISGKIGLYAIFEITTSAAFYEYDAGRFEIHDTDSP